MLTNAIEKERKNVERGVGGRERKQVRSWRTGHIRNAYTPDGFV